MIHDTTHVPCPVDGKPCWRERAQECPHVIYDRRPCVMSALTHQMVKYAATWAALAKE